MGSADAPPQPSAQHPSPHDDDPLLQARLERMAAVLVDAGWVAPALEVDGLGRLRARWWPLPAAEDRPCLDALLPCNDPRPCLLHDRPFLFGFRLG
jgi:hypothetical protein